MEDINNMITLEDNIMQIEFVGSPIKNIKSKIRHLINNSENVKIAVAYLKNSGLESIKQSLKENRQNNNISIITGLDFGITDSESLLELQNMNIGCNIINDLNFHPKLYIFENFDSATMILGSSNLSEGGLAINYEANIIITGKKSESPLKDAIEYFSFLQSKSIPLDEKIIKLYRESTLNSDKHVESNNEKERELKEYLTNITKINNKFIEVILNATNVEDKYIYIRAPYRNYFPPIKVPFKILTEEGDEFITHLEGSYRIPGITKFFDNHPEYIEGDKIYIDVIEPKKMYLIKID